MVPACKAHVRTYIYMIFTLSPVETYTVTVVLVVRSKQQTE